MTLSIDGYRAEDEAAVIDLWTRVFGYTERRNQPRYVLAEKLAQDDGLLLLAREQGRLVGTAIGGYDGHRGWLYSVAVAPERRRRGIGRSLVRAMERALLAAGAPKINLQVRAGNDAVIGFYQALGWSLEPHKSMGKVARGIAPARPADLAELAALVSRAGLPTEALEPRLPTTRVAREEGALVGCVALEPLGRAGLLCSLCVCPERRGEGLGRRLATQALELARDRGVRDLYLFTRTGRDYFETLGFSPLRRAQLPQPVAATREARELCPQDATAMVRRLA